ncbi:MAG: hypothetical protein MUP90_02650 [Gammaproteobacteria bacterium]|nr:hypothetical protein [Gammaproteobacteria bacterium]
METDRVSRWLTFGSNVGVLIGIVILIFELRQSSAIAEAQFYLDQVNLNETAELAMLGENPAAVWEKSVFDPKTLSPADVRVMDAYLGSRLYVWSDMLVLEERGFTERGATAENMNASIAFFFGTTFAQTWWKQERETGNWGDRLTAMIDAAMLTVDPSTSRNRTSKLQGTPHE